MLFVNIAGLLLIALIVWWFWLYHPAQAQSIADDLLVTVEDGVYTPSRIKIPANKNVTLHFLRKDASPCAEMLIIPGLQISQSLPLNKTTDIEIPATSAGEYDFHCQMQMYRGKLNVSEVTP